MKAFVIKNKDGKYLDSCQDFETNNIWDARLFDDYKEALSFSPKDCEVVEIIIAEGDLEQQLADKEVKIEVLERDVENLHRTLQEANEQLAEKDKEIEFLKISASFEKEHKNKILEYINQIRKQVCDEIRELLQKQKIQADDGIHAFLQDMCYWQDIDAILDKVERGE